MKANTKLRKTLQQEEDLRATKYIESLSMDHNTNYSLWKATKTIKPPVESKKSLRKPCGAWARSVILFANHLSDVFKPIPPVIQEILDNSDLVEVDLAEFKQIVKHTIKSKQKKTPGNDMITPEMIKI